MAAAHSTGSVRAPGDPDSAACSAARGAGAAGDSGPRPSTNGRGGTLRLTEMGEGLAVCDAMGQWGAGWLEMSRGISIRRTCYGPREARRRRHGSRGRRSSVPLGPGRRQSLDAAAPVAARAVYPRVGLRRGPRLPTDGETLVDLHLQRTSYVAALRSRRLVLDGPRALTRAFAPGSAPARSPNTCQPLPANPLLGRFIRPPAPSRQTARPRQGRNRRQPAPQTVTTTC